MYLCARSEIDTAIEPARSAAAQSGDAQGAKGEQPASGAKDTSIEAGAACLVQLAAGAADELGIASSGSGTSNGRKKTTARKHHNPAQQMGRKPPPAKSNLGPRLKLIGKARKSTQMAAAQPTAPAGEEQSEEAPQQPVAPEEELQGAAEEDIARVNIEYNLTTPHEVGTLQLFPDCCA